MSKDTPTEEELERGVAALAPFVHEWKLPLNPENLFEMVWAVLTHAQSDVPFTVIDTAVRQQLTLYKSEHERMLDAMRQKSHEVNDTGDNQS